MTLSVIFIFVAKVVFFITGNYLFQKKSLCYLPQNRSHITLLPFRLVQLFICLDMVMKLFIFKSHLPPSQDLWVVILVDPLISSF
jgi:hypothetical protein